jgi:type II secretory pathway predicted ATPase ExeA
LEPTEPARLVLVSAHRKLLDEIVDSLMEGTQFLALTGTPRAGKTTMAAAIHEELNKHSVLVRRVYGCRGTGIHLRTVMSQFLDKPEANVGADDVEQLFYVMTERETPDERLALIIDDAERLLPDVLAYLRLLVSVAPERMPQIVFIGAPSFWDIAGQLTEAGFKDLITARFVLEPLNPTKTFEATEQVISALRNTPRPVLDQGALDAIATERDQTQRLAGGTASLVADGLVPRLELGIKAATTPALARHVPTLVPELSTLRPDRSVARITSAAAVLVGAIGVATYWLAPFGIDRILTEGRAAVGHPDGTEAASPDATIQVRLPFSASALQAQSDVPDFDSESAFPISTLVPTSRSINTSVLGPKIRPGADSPIAKAGTLWLQERAGDHVSSSSKGIWLFPPNVNSGG